MAFGYGLPTDWSQGSFGDWGLMPSTSGIDPTVLSSLSPGDAWQQARLNQMGSYANVPRFRDMAMQGFVPAYGSYLLGGGLGGTFGQYLPSVGGTAAPQTAIGIPATDPEAFTRAAQVSDWMSGYGSPQGAAQQYGIENVTTQGAGADLARNIAMGQYLTGENARANQLAMAMAGMGITGGGIGAQATQRGLGSLYDLYRARQVTGPTGDASGFLGYLSRLRNQTGTV